MATIELRNNRFRLIFYHLGRRYAARLKTTNEREADAVADSVERTLQLLQQRVLAIPDGADLVTFVLSGGKQEEKLKPPPRPLTLGELRDLYVAAHSLGAMEANSLKTVKMHLKHIVTTLGTQFAITKLTLEDLQRHIERRARKKYRGRPQGNCRLWLLRSPESVDRSWADRGRRVNTRITEEAVVSSLPSAGRQVRWGLLLRCMLDWPVLFRQITRGVFPISTATRFLRRDLADVRPWAETCGQIHCLIEEKDGTAAEVHHVRSQDAKLHYHSRTDEFYYIIAGQGTMILDNEQIELQEGVVVYVLRGVKHKAIGELPVLTVCVPAGVLSDIHEVGQRRVVHPAASCPVSKSA
jgi:mannose-6-phosphate isomerase-like protein (cupin superfamily)